MNSSGNIYASNDVNVGHQVNAQYVWASGNLNSNYIHSNGNIDADGRLNAGEFLYINGKANVGQTVHQMVYRHCIKWITVIMCRW
jgi:hypothetical protein